MAKEIVSFTNDVFFKFFMCGDDEKSKYVRHFIIRSITGINPIDSTVLNPEIIPDKERGNKIVLDVRVRDEEGREFDIEMQMYGATLTECMRFQYYAAKMLAGQTVVKSHYEKLKPVYEIIFMDRETDKDLISHYQFIDKDGDPIAGNLLNLYIISLKNINKIKQEKGIKGMNSFEKLCYLFKNGLTSDILEVDGREIGIVVDKYKEMKDNLDVWSYAMACEIGERRIELVEQDRYNEGMDKGVAIGKEKGKVEGKIESLQEILHSKFHSDDVDWLKTLSERQLNKLLLQTFQCDTVSDLKKSVNTTDTVENS